MQTYTHYKDSGIDWIGQIPEHWEVKKVKEICSMNGRIGFRGYSQSDLVSEGEGAITISPSNIVENQMNFDKNTYLSWEKYFESPEIMVSNDDILIVKTGSTVGKVGIVKNLNIEATINPQLLVIKNIKTNIQFTYEYLHSNIFYDFVKSNAIGSTIPTISETKIGNLPIIYPPIHEQESIANFLDEKTAKIDALVQTKEQQIEKLKELRQAKIHQAVTKGLDANAPTKDSGIEWIGEIPAHWEVSKVKNYLKIPITDGPHTTPILLDEGIPFISAEAIKNGKIDFNKKRGNISEEDYKLFSQKYVPQRNDIYMIKSGATTGNIAMVETDDIFTIWSPLAVFRSNHRILPKFLYNILQSSYFKTSVELSWSFGTQQNIGMGVLSNLYITIPISLKEQEQIVAYLDEMTGKIDQAIAQKQEQITKLKEYKQSLINDVVTGKVKVC